jgi:hypothetical protein
MVGPKSFKDPGKSLNVGQVFVPGIGNNRMGQRDEDDNAIRIATY